MTATYRCLSITGFHTLKQDIVNLPVDRAGINRSGKCVIPVLYIVNSQVVGAACATWILSIWLTHHCQQTTELSLWSKFYVPSMQTTTYVNRMVASQPRSLSVRFQRSTWPSIMCILFDNQALPTDTTLRLSSGSTSILPKRCIKRPTRSMLLNRCQCIFSKHKQSPCMQLTWL